MQTSRWAGGVLASPAWALPDSNSGKATVTPAACKKRRRVFELVRMTIVVEL